MWRVCAEHEATGQSHLLTGEYATREEAQQVATEMYGGFDDVDYWPEEACDDVSDPGCWGWFR